MHIVALKETFYSRSILFNTRVIACRNGPLEMFQTRGTIWLQSLENIGLQQFA